MRCTQLAGMQRGRSRADPCGGRRRRPGRGAARAARRRRDLRDRRQRREARATCALARRRARDELAHARLRRRDPRRTDGAGVDVVLNSLAGDFIRESLRRLRAGGRFLEIGKTGIWTAEQMTAARPGRRATHAIDLGDVDHARCPVDAARAGRRRSTQGDAAAAAAAACSRSTTRPTRSASWRRRSTSARSCSRSPDAARPPAPRSATTRPTWSPAVSARWASRSRAWLARARARAIWCCMGRARAVARPRDGRSTRCSKARARACIVAQATSRSRDDVARGARPHRGGMPPLRGIVHAAGVLDDGVSPSRLDAVSTASGAEGVGRLAPARADRAAAARLLRAVLLDGGGARIARAGQLRGGERVPRRAGRTAARPTACRRLSINWGPWADGGMAASLRTPGSRAREHEHGLLELTRRTGRARRSCACCHRPVAGDRRSPADWKRVGAAAGRRRAVALSPTRPQAGAGRAAAPSSRRPPGSSPISSAARRPSSQRRAGARARPGRAGAGHRPTSASSTRSRG